jgi:hypothetical protein
MNKISNLVKAQNRYKNLTHLDECIGDGYLYSRNLIFRNLRNSVVKLDVSFSDRLGLFHYQSCPNLSFSKILRTKKIPYLKNVRPLLAVETFSPLLKLQKIPEIKKNNIMHESSHIFAQSILGHCRRKKGDLKAQCAFVLTSLLSESFASASETFGQIFVAGDIHQWMYRQNVNLYGCDAARYRQLLTHISKKYGIKMCFKLAIVSFMYWNFFIKRITPGDLVKVVPLCRMEKTPVGKTERLILEFCNFHFHIHGFFRREVAEFYFKAAGLEKPLAELLRFDFISHLLKSDEWPNKLQKLVDILGAET